MDGHKKKSIVQLAWVIRETLSSNESCDSSTLYRTVYNAHVLPGMAYWSETWGVTKLLKEDIGHPRRPQIEGLYEQCLGQENERLGRLCNRNHHKSSKPNL